MSKSNRLTASLEVPSSSRGGPSPVSSPISSRYGPKYRIPDNTVAAGGGLSTPAPPPAAVPSQEVTAAKAELTRLKAREAILVQMLEREKEHRVKAEQLVEVEKIACLELKLHLHREKKKSGEEEVEIFDYSVGDSEEEDAKEPGVETGPPCRYPLEGEKGKGTTLTSLSEDVDFSPTVLESFKKLFEVTNKSGHTSQSAFCQALAAIKADDHVHLELSGLTPEDGIFLLKMAAERGHTACLRVLLAAGKFDPSGSKVDGTTPLHLAAENAHIRCLEALLEYEAKVEAANIDGRTPLFLALLNGKKECAKKLFEATTNLDFISARGETFLHAATMGNLPSLLRSIIVTLKVECKGSRFSELLNWQDDERNTALHNAVAMGSKSCTELLCACEELDQDLRNKWKRTALDGAKDDTKKILLNRETKLITLYIQLSPQVLPQTIWGYIALDEEGETLNLAVGQIGINRTHHINDLEVMATEALNRFCFALDSNNLQRPGETGGCGFDDAHADFLVKLRNRYELAKEFIGPILKSALIKSDETGKSSLESSEGGSSSGRSSGKDSWNESPLGTENENVTSNADCSKNRNESPLGMKNWNVNEATYTKHCRKVISQIQLSASALGLSETSTVGLTAGSLSWKAGKLPKRLQSKDLYAMSLFDKDRSFHVSLRDSDGHDFDQLALKLMFPLADMKKYGDMLTQHKKLLIRGSYGSGKSHLAWALSAHIKGIHGADSTRVIHVSLTPNFQRGDLFRLFHSNGLLLPEAATIDGVEVRPPPPKYKAYVIIFDDLSLLPQQKLVVELMAILKYRGAGYSSWINEVLSPNGQEILYPEGLYYLREECHVIVTWTSGDGAVLQVGVASHFPKVFLNPTSGPLSGVLRRHLMASLIHSTGGVLPSVTDPLYRMLQWVSDIWLLYNVLLDEVGLAPTATVGLRHFLSCPVDSSCPERDISEWLRTMWHHHLAPSLELVLQDTLNFRTYQELDRSKEIARMLFQAIIGCVYLPTCPLAYDDREQFVQGLLKNMDSFLFIGCVPTGNTTREGSVSPTKPLPPPKPLPPKPVPVAQPYYPSPPPPPAALSASKSELRRGSFQPSSGLRKKGLLHKGTPHLTERRGSLTDLRMRPKEMNMVSIADLRNSPNPRTKERKATKSESFTSSSPPVGSDEALRYGSKKGKANKALLKIRHKTISLFSREGRGTIHGLFRRGSRAGAEEDPGNPFSPPSATGGSPTKRDFTQSLDAATFSDQLGRRGSAPPSSPVQVMTLSDEERETAEALNKYDFLDLITDSTTDRMEQQRSPLPPGLSKKYNRTQNVPRYYLPTSLRQESRSPMHSMPNLSMGGTLEEEVEYTDSETSPTSPLATVSDEGNLAQYQGSSQQSYLDGSFQYLRDAPSLRYDLDTSLQQYRHQDTSFQDPRYQDAIDSHQRSASYDVAYEQQQTSNVADNDLKTRSAADMGETDQIVEKYWEVATPPYSGTPTAMVTTPSPPPVVMTPSYGNFLSPDDAKRCSLKRPASPLTQKAYTTADSPDKVSASGAIKHFTYQMYPDKPDPHMYCPSPQGSDISELEVAVNLGPSDRGMYSVAAEEAKSVKSSGRSAVGPSWVKVSGKGKKTKKLSKKEISKSQPNALSKYHDQQKPLVLSPPGGHHSPPLPPPKGSPSSSTVATRPPPHSGVPSPQLSPSKSTLTRGRYVNLEVGRMYRERTGSLNVGGLHHDTPPRPRPRGNSSGQARDNMLFGASLGFSRSRDGLDEQEEEIL